MSREIEKRFKSGYVAIIGQPNVGKSTLLNQLLDFKVASVSRKPQTTRHRITGILSGAGFQVVFLDTPGLLEPKYKLQEAMLKASQRAAQEADLGLFLITAQPQANDRDVEHLMELKRVQSKVILAINKVDLIQKKQLLPLMDFYINVTDLTAVVPISALKADGLQQLQQEIIKALPNGLPFYDTDQVMDHPERFLVSEIIREKIFLLYGAEIPYSTTVTIEEFKERTKAKDFIRAAIYVEKRSQKGILIGKKGEALKKVGAAARQEIEATLGRQVFLELWIKVKEKWRDDEKTLKDFGYL